MKVSRIGVRAFGSFTRNFAISIKKSNKKTPTLVAVIRVFHPNYMKLPKSLANIYKSEKSSRSEWPCCRPLASQLNMPTFSVNSSEFTDPVRSSTWRFSIHMAIIYFRQFPQLFESSRRGILHRTGKKLRIRSCTWFLSCAKRTIIRNSSAFSLNLLTFRYACPFTDNGSHNKNIHWVLENATNHFQSIRSLSASSIAQYCKAGIRNTSTTTSHATTEHSNQSASA